MTPFYGWGSTVSRLQSIYEETAKFLPSPQEFLVLAWSITEGWTAESTLKPPSSIDPRIPELGMQRIAVIAHNNQNDASD